MTRNSKSTPPFSILLIYLWCCRSKPGRRFSVRRFSGRRFGSRRRFGRALSYDPAVRVFTIGIGVLRAFVFADRDEIADAARLRLDGINVSLRGVPA